MTNVFLYVAGTLTLFISVVHGYLGATKVVGPSTAPSASTKRILHAIMFLSAVYWFVGGVALLAAPHLVEGNVRQWVVYAVAAMLLTGAIGNIWATRAKHFGGYFLLIVSGLAIAGA